ncbi:MAG TPA: hypothetical protein VGT42_02555 [Gammaproteobacteria bacterium]|nr:hypothetical protein [Gammaproteobacteria bacterium]
MQTVVLRRALVIWYLMPLMLAIGLYEWYQYLTGAYSHAYRYRQGSGMLALPVALIAAVYDLYARFIRRDRLEFSEAGVGDYASSDRLGEIRWEAVDGVAVNRKFFGDSIIIHFKQSVPLNHQVESWDRIVIGSLRVSDDDMGAITALLKVRGIAGGEDGS